MTEQRALETAILGGGCFWRLEAVFQQVQGVQSTVSGYTGDHVGRPGYRTVCNGNTGRVEVVTVKLDPTVIPYRKIFDIFFAIRSPTTVDHQGNDVGLQYRSAIFAQMPEQLATVCMAIAELGASDILEASIATELVDAADDKVIF